MTSVDHPAEIMTHARVQLRRCRKTDVDTVHRIVTESRSHLRPGFAEIDRRTPPRAPLMSGEIGIDVI